MTDEPKKPQRFARVVLKSSDLEALLRFLHAHPVDLIGRPHPVGKKWRAEFFLPEQDAKQLTAEGCEVFVDEQFLDRLRAAHIEAQQKKPSAERLEKLFAERRFPGVQIDAKGNVREVE